MGFAERRTLPNYQPDAGTLDPRHGNVEEPPIMTTLNEADNLGKGRILPDLPTFRAPIP
jgi:hypothetical protein